MRVRRDGRGENRSQHQREDWRTNLGKIQGLSCFRESGNPLKLKLGVLRKDDGSINSNQTIGCLLYSHS